jgi:hypothetical protein
MAMTPSGKTNFASGYVGAPVVRYCPECGQPLTVTQSHDRPAGPIAVPWRSIFLLGFGLFLSVTFGLGAWHASQTKQLVTVCQGAVGQTDADCIAPPSPLAQQFAATYLTGGFGLSPRLVDRDVGSDLRYLVVGLIGLGVGLGAGYLRLKSARRRGFVAGVVRGSEGLLTVVYGEIFLLGSYFVVAGPQAGASLTLPSLGDGMYRALSHVFALVGGQ